METQHSVEHCRGCGTDHAAGSPECPLTRIGTTIGGRYRVERLLGAGGMGAVYAAENLQLGRRVALKLLHPQLAARPDIVDRFRREARSVANLKHPGFAQVYALDHDESGQFFIEMELLDGVPLDRLIGDGVVPIRRCIAILASALDALAVAHDAGLVHRDLKPENLFLCSDPRLGEYVKVLDFGIARAADDMRMTASGQFIGTITYASPEQLRDASTADARSDIYSFGATAYELLARATTAGGGSYAEVVTRIMTQEIERSIAAKRPDAPAWLDAMIQRALAVDPAQRYANAGEMLRALRAHEHEPLPTGPHQLATTTGTGSTHAAPTVPGGRSKLPWVIGAVAVAGIAVGAIVLARSTTTTTPTPAPVVIDANVQPIDAIAIVPIDPPPDAAPPDAAPPDAAPSVPKPERPRPTKTADELNEEGKRLMFSHQPDEAVVKFRQAVRLEPSAKHYFNLCSAQYMTAHYKAARGDCKRGLAAAPDIQLRNRLAAMITLIDKELAR